jgi:Secretion system C-terminal sorting domain
MHRYGILLMICMFFLSTFLYSANSVVTITSGAYFTLTAESENKSYLINSGADDGQVIVNIGGSFIYWASEALIDFTVTDDNPLPVTLTSFEANFSKNNVVLNWITQSETDNLGFNLFRSENENGYENSLSLNSTLIPGMGITSTPSNYSFADEYPVIEGHTYYYWLQSVSTTNELELFGPVDLEIPNIGQLPTITMLEANFPNPFNPETTIAFNIKENETGILSIFNLKGEKILKQEFEAGNHQYHWNADGLSSGVYFYKLASPTINMTRKMILIK